MSQRVGITTDDLQFIRRAVKCPGRLVQSESEKTFLEETRARLDKFGEQIFLSEKQINWLRKVAARVESNSGKKGSSKMQPRPVEDLPSYNEFEGE